MLHEVLQRKAPQRAATTLWSLNLRSNGTDAEIKLCKHRQERFNGGVALLS